MAISKIVTNSVDSGVTITSPVINTITSASATALTLQSAGTTAITVDTSQNVGIGTSSPAYKLDITGQGRATTGFAVSTDGSTFTPATLNAIPNYGVGYITSTAQTALSGFGGIPFYTNQLERMRIDSSGNLLVGTTSSDIAAVGIRLMNNNQLQASKSGDWSFRMGRRDSTGIVTEIYYNSSRVGDIATNGTGTSYNSASDYRLKENVEPMTGALAKVTLLKPCTYKWKVDGSEGQGFIAHELAEVVPDAVRGTKDEIDADGNPQYQGIDTSFLVATLTAAIQEQQALIIQLQADVAALKGIK